MVVFAVDPGVQGEIEVENALVLEGRADGREGTILELHTVAGESPDPGGKAVDQSVAHMAGGRSLGTVVAGDNLEEWGERQGVVEVAGW